MIESELKLKVDVIEITREKILTLGTQIEERTHELTTIYDNAQQLMQVTDGRLRVRKRTNSKGVEIILSYKKPLSRERIKQEIEHETTIDDEKALGSILESIGYHPVSSYERYRTNFLVEASDRRALVSLDEFPFGNYIEIEGEDIEFCEKVAFMLGLDTMNHLANSYDGIFNTLELAKGNKPNSNIRF